MFLMLGPASASAPAGACGGASLTVQRCPFNSAPKFTNPIPPLFSNRKSKHPLSCRTTRRCPRPLTIAAAESGGGPPPVTAATKPNPATTSSKSTESAVSFVGEESVPLEGVIQFEKPNSSSQLNKWGRVALLAGGDVLALLLFSAIGRFSHGFPVLDSETLRTADPFIAGWFLSAYFLGGYSEDGRGMNGRSNAVVAAAKSWALGIPLGIIIRAAAMGHVPKINFILVTMGSTAVLLIGWRALLSGILSGETKKNDVFKRGSPFELFELLTSLVRRW